MVYGDDSGGRRRADGEILRQAAYLAGRRAAAKLLPALLKLIAPVLPWVLLVFAVVSVVLIVLLSFYAVAPGGDLNADNTRDQLDAEMKRRYVEAVEENFGPVRDYYQKELDHKLEWGVLYALDEWRHTLAKQRAAAEGQKWPDREFSGERSAKELAPRFEYRPSTITVETTCCTEEGCDTSTSVQEIELLTKADTYRGRYYYSYRWETQMYSSGKCTVTVTKEVLDETKYEEDWSRFDRWAARLFEVEESELTPEARQMILQMGYGVTSEEGEQALAWLFSEPVLVAGAVLDEIPPEYLELFKEAGKRYGVPWHVLAAVAKVESGFRPDAVGPPNYTGELAQGMMQFLPSTWAEWGVDADGDGEANPFDPEDAVYSAARYLVHLGIGKDARRALYGYNHSWDYVDAVLQIAEGYRIQELYGGPGYSWPVAYAGWRITSYFGAQEEGLRTSPHTGVDIAAPVGTPVVAVIDGTVIEISYEWPGGRQLFLRGADGNLYCYAHLDGYAPDVAVGRPVSSGQVIGYVGMTGRTTGPHLHFGVKVGNRWVDPLLIFRK
ncbi:MAG: peptidoglycan DD-metalloendopeptidase family protein [Moorellales bacterium]